VVERETQDFTTIPGNCYLLCGLHRVPSCVTGNHPDPLILIADTFGYVPRIGGKSSYNMLVIVFFINDPSREIYEQ